MIVQRRGLEIFATPPKNKSLQIVTPDERLAIRILNELASKTSAEANHRYKCPSKIFSMSH